MKLLRKRSSLSLVLIFCITLFLGSFFILGFRMSDTSLREHLPWVSRVGAGLVGPACGSSSTTGSCSLGLASQTVSWNIDGCTAPVTVSLTGGAQATGQACSGSYTFTGLTTATNYTYSLQYLHWDGSTITENYSFTTPSCTPYVSFTVGTQLLFACNSTNITWSSAGATSCTGTNFSTSGATSGTVSASVCSTTDFGVSCTGPGGTVSAGGAGAGTVTVINPVLSLTASASQVNSGDSTTLTWSSTETNSCTLTGTGVSRTGTSGSVTTPAITAQTTYTLTCQTDAGPVSATKTITLTGSFNEF